MLEQELPNVPGKTFTSEVVDFPPSARAVPHRHGDAFVYAYVLEGTVRSQLDNEPVRTYRAGEHWGRTTELLPRAHGERELDGTGKAAGRHRVEHRRSDQGR
ncbi:hypothetical protein [Streptomyces sp. LN500]|uniref:hypothetical protein n=1 Tax=Streptomyces sp. LN500 TaxID=3112978 RepID=UPI0037143D06